MTHIIRVFDNKGRTRDRYTVVIDGEVFGMSSDPSSPKGFNQAMGAVGELREVLESLGGIYKKNVGEEIELLSLPLSVRLAVGKRLSTIQKSP
jgi:hypothetical protein